MTEPAITIVDLMDKLPRWFKGPSWAAWRVFLRALFGAALAEEELEVFRRCTGRMVAPTAQAREGWLVCGRRAGKSLIAAFLAFWAAVFRRYDHLLAPGERALVVVVAADRRQARVIFRYICAFFDSSDRLTDLVERRTLEAIHLKNGTSIEVHAGSFRGIRGYTIVCFVGDEIAFWRDEASANPDVEILNAVRPAQATVPGAIFLCLSSPYARRGALWNTYSRHFGKDGSDTLVWQAPSRVMNPTLPEHIVDEALAQDEATARAEWLAEFRRDLEAYVSQETIAACVVPDRHVLPPVRTVDYVGFVDPAGGSGGDSMTLAIAHEADGRAVLDLVLERKPPFSPEDVTAEFCGTLAEYRVGTVVGDHYGGDWPAERFDTRGVRYKRSEATKSKIYKDFLPRLNSGQVELLDAPRLLAQLLGLERRVARGGNDSIDHAPGARDDLINATAGALMLAAPGLPKVRMWGGNPYKTTDEEHAAEERERKEQSAEMIRGAIAKHGMYWPGEGAPRMWGKT
jgi:hypothetical protein